MLYLRNKKQSPLNYALKRGTWGGCLSCSREGFTKSLYKNGSIRRSFMKRRFFPILIFAVSILAAFAACKTCPDPGAHEKSGVRDFIPDTLKPIEENWVPLTITLLRQILNNNNNDWDGTLKQMQFRISDEINLERIFTDTEIKLLEGTAYKDIYELKIPIPVHRNQYGMGQGVRSVGSGWQERFFLSVGFDKRDVSLQLQFSSIGDHRDELIYLDYTPNENKNVMGKGTLYYGPDDDRHLYTVKYDGNRTPYLLIDLRENRDVKTDPRPVPGLRLGDL